MLDLSRLLPGPFCTLILADLGAEVTKVEDTGGGDYLRAMPPQRDGLGGAFYALNRGKRSLSVDLKQAEGREVLLRLLPHYDVLVESFRPGVLDRLGLTPEVLEGANPALIVCRISGYGQSGPLARRAGHDINFQALAGTLALGGDASTPAIPGAQLADVAGGALWATIRILATLAQRGPPAGHRAFTDLDVSMTEGAMSLLLPWLGDLAFGGLPPRRGAGVLNGGRAAYGTYRCADDVSGGRHLAVGALEPKFWQALRGHLNQPVAMSDFGDDEEHQAALREQLADALGTSSRAHWWSALETVDACVEPVLELDELADHPQHRARGSFFELEDPQRGPSEQLTLPLGEPPLATTPAPRQGEHSAAILAEAGYDDHELQSLLQRRVVRTS